LDSSEDFWQTIQDLNQRTKQLESFYKRYYQEFNGFKILKIVHFLRNNFYQEIPVLEASNRLLSKLDTQNQNFENIGELLKRYRDLDKGF